MKNILVTGAAGFIGSNLVDHLLKDPSVNSIVGVDNLNSYYDPEIKKSNYKEHTKEAKYKFYTGDLCDYDFISGVFEDAEKSGKTISHVVHLAAMAGVRPSVENPVLYDRNNNGSTSNLLDIMSKRKDQIKKHVFGSSSSVYGSRKDNGEGFKESDDISKPISPYAATKVASEAVCHAFSHLYKIPTVALRFFTVYGPRQRPDLAIHKFTRLIDEGKEIEVYGDGSARRDYTYIDDIVDGILKAIDYDKSNFEIFNLGESHTTDVNTLISLIEKALAKKAKVLYKDPIPGDVPITYADISKSKKLLAYDPQTLIEDGIPKYVQWYLQAMQSA